MFNNIFHKFITVFLVAVFLFVDSTAVCVLAATDNTVQSGLEGSLVYADTESYSRDKTVNFSDGKTAKFIAVVVTGDVGGGIRMRELELKDESGNKLSLDKDIKSASLARLTLDGRLSYELIHSNDGITDVKQVLFDNDTVNHFDINMDFDGVDWSDKATIVVELEKSVKLSEIKLCTGTFNSEHYNSVKIYVSEEFDFLLSESDDFNPHYSGDKKVTLGGNLVYVDGDNYPQNKTVAFSAPRQGKYIAIVLTGSADGYWSRLREIEIYNSENKRLTSQNGVISITTGRFRNGKFETADANPSDLSDKMFDGVYTNSDFFVNTSDGWNPALVVELSNVSQLSKICVYTGVKGHNEYKHAAKIYLSDSLDTLFCESEIQEESLVYSDPKSDYALDKSVTFGSPRTARYIAVMVRKVPQVYPRMREIEIYDADGNLLALSDEEQYNGIRYATAFSYHPDKFPYYVTSKVVCNETETVEQAVTYLFDKNKGEHWDFSNAEWANYIGFLIELDKDIALSKINVYTGMSTSAPEPIDIYVSKSITNLLGEPAEYTAAASPYQELSSGELGVLNSSNLLSNRTPQVINWETRDVRSISGGSVDMLTDGNYGAHLDINGLTDENNHPVVIYDMMYPTEFSAVLFSGISGGSQADYAPSYEIYIGNDYSTLISSENLVKAMDQTKVAASAVKKMQYYAFDKKITGRYIAFYITQNARNTEAPYAAASARISELGAWGTYKSAEIGDVNADNAIDILDFIKLKLIIGAGINDITPADIYYDEHINSEDLISLTKLLLTGSVGKRCGKSAYTDTDYEITVDLDTVVNEQWNGIGGNVMPMTLMTGYDSSGYNDAYWDAEVSRIIKLKPQIVRMWFQVDWLEREKDVVNWDTAEMKAFIKYIAAFKEAGVDVQITHNWKVGSLIQNWFSFQNVSNRYESAPADLDHYARSCYRLIKGLHDKGYTNVKYLTYANEPNIGDFETPANINQLDYYIEMAGKVSDYFTQMNYRDKIEIWGCESSVMTDWVKRCSEYPEYFDALSWHDYGANKDSIVDDIDYVQSSSVKRLYLSEYSEFAFKYLPSIVISGANNGLTGVLNWCMNGVSDMAAYQTNNHWSMNNNNADFWNSFTSLNNSSALELGGVNRGYYIASLFNNYIAKGSAVVKSTVSNQYARSAVFVDTDTGDITIAVEFDKMSKNRSVTLNLGNINGKTFYKHFYCDASPKNQNATVPATSAVFKNVSGCFTDYDIEDEVSVVIYTTKAPLKQVSLNNAFVELKAGESFNFEADIVDSDGSEEIEWKILTAANHRDNNTGRNGTLSSNGKKALYKAASNAVGVNERQTDSQDVVSIEARIKGTDIYTVAIIRIIK